VTASARSCPPLTSGTAGGKVDVIELPKIGIKGNRTC
jgi:hypothetical protein